jgi:hypothetical protein
MIKAPFGIVWTLVGAATPFSTWSLTRPHAWTHGASGFPCSRGTGKCGRPRWFGNHVRRPTRCQALLIANLETHGRGADAAADPDRSGHPIVAVSLVSSGEVATIALEECKSSRRRPGSAEPGGAISQDRASTRSPFRGRARLPERTLTPMGAGGGVGCATGESEVWADTVARSCFDGRTGSPHPGHDSPASRDTCSENGYQSVA